MRRFVLLLAAFIPSICVAPAESVDRPNVLFIAVDDLRVELGCYGQHHVHSPHIDQLASEGTLFERAYCQQTVCNPSRASLLTGMRPDTLRVWDLPTHFRVGHPDAVTLPQTFMNNGYFVRGIGKIFHNWRQDDWKGDPASWSVPSILHYGTHGNDKPEVSGTPAPNLASGWKGLECRDVPDEAYYDGRVASATVKALQELSRQSKPFFLAAGFWKPHTPFNAPKKYWDLYDREDVPIPARITPPDSVPDIALTPDRVRRNMTVEQLRELHHGHLAAISYLDAQIGRVLKTLNESRLKDNTIVVFWSDHGLHLGEHGLMRKTTVFELDARVPLIIRTPDGMKGQRTESLVELLDLYPTLTDLCSLNAPPSVQGTSLVPLLKDPRASVRDVALTQTPRPNYLRGKQQPEAMGYSIRTSRYRYTEWRDFSSGRTVAAELYDHSSDPGETRNLANAPHLAGELPRLSQLLQQAVGGK